MQFFETADREEPSPKTVAKAKRHLMRMLSPYLIGSIKENFEKPRNKRGFLNACINSSRAFKKRRTEFIQYVSELSYMLWSRAEP
jgi:hypothetical protein